jgi:hypothetical protein
MIGGEVLLVGDSPANVKLGGFYTHCHDFYYASQHKPQCPRACLVSNVASLGASGGNFLLTFDVSWISPSAGHYIYLILGNDQNRNGEFDPLEDWRYVIPLYDDAVFQGATDCVYYYDNRSNECIGTAPGWNQSVGLDHYAPVDCAARDGARLSNEVAWCAGAASHGVLTRFSDPG